MLKIFIKIFLIIFIGIAYSANNSTVSAQSKVIKNKKIKRSKRSKSRRVARKRKAKCVSEVIEFTKSFDLPEIKTIPNTFIINEKRKLRVSRVDDSYLADLYLPIFGGEEKDHIRFKLQCNLNLKCKRSHKVKFNGVWSTKKIPEWDLNQSAVGIVYGGRTILMFTLEDENRFNFTYTNLVNSKKQKSGFKVTCEL